MAGNKVGNRYDLMALALTVGAAETASGKRGEGERGCTFECAVVVSSPAYLSVGEALPMLS